MSADAAAGPAQGFAGEGHPASSSPTADLAVVRGPTSTTGARIDDPRVDEVRILRPQEIPVYVADGLFDLGITGRDWIEETGADVVSLGELRLLQGHAPTPSGSCWPWPATRRSTASRTFPRASRVSTEYPELTRRCLEKQGVHAEVRLSYGATEAKIPDIADAVVEITETGPGPRPPPVCGSWTRCSSRAPSSSPTRRAAADPVKRHAMSQLLTLLLRDPGGARQGAAEVERGARGPSSTR